MNMVAEDYRRMLESMSPELLRAELAIETDTLKELMEKEHSGPLYEDWILRVGDSRDAIDYIQSLMSRESMH
jgi:hypothetical protein